jgi:Protein of unknown function (DUF3617)
MLTAAPLSSFFGFFGPLVLMAASAPAAETFPARLYEVTTETGMPHLEENLRYTVTREKHCLTHRELAAAFPILGHPALKDCRLKDEMRRKETVSYLLVCTSGHGTTGEATWHIDEHRIRGTLNVKLGGKNMTFYQRVTALPLGACAP